MPPYSRSEIISGLFVVLAVAVFALFAFNIIQVDLPFTRDKAIPFTADLDYAATLAPGDKVIFAGKEVGTVTDIRIKAVPDPDNPGRQMQVIAADFQITDPTLRLDPETATVSVGQIGLLSRHHIELDPGTSAADAPPILESADPSAPPIVLEATMGSSIDAVIAQAGPAFQRIANVLTKIDDGILSERNLDEVDQTLKNLEDATALATAYLEQANPDGVSAQVLQPAKQLLTRANTAIDELQERLAEVTLTEAETLLTEATTTVKQIREFAQRIDTEVQERTPEFRRALSRLSTAAENIDNQIKSVGTDASEVLRLSQTVLAENRPELAESIRRLRRSMTEAELLLRKVRANPARLIFGDDEKLFDVDQTDAGWLIRTGRAQPFEQRDEE
ncbi:MAG: MlaD family protein [Planctomycetota bacterium]